jgi:hypothetical protein
MLSFVKKKKIIKNTTPKTNKIKTGEPAVTTRIH